MVSAQLCLRRLLVCCSWQGWQGSSAAAVGGRAGVGEARLPPCCLCPCSSGKQPALVSDIFAGPGVSVLERYQLSSPGDELPCWKVQQLPQGGDTLMCACRVNRSQAPRWSPA